MKTPLSHLLGLLLTIAALAPGSRAVAQVYDVRTSTVNVDRRERPALKVQVEGSTALVREYFQDFMKENYNIRFKTGGVLGIGGSKDVLTAKQTPVSSVSGKLIDFYANVVAPSDTTTEVQVFASFDNGTTWLDPERTPSEFAALRTIVNNFARESRAYFYKVQVQEAEKLLVAAQNEKVRLEKDIKTTQENTTSNLAKIQQLQQQNEKNVARVKDDEEKLVQSTAALERQKTLLQRRRDRLAGLDRK
ncbi:hypothetical protein F0P96_07060 [Hymenobacter busanensis]|uniref:Uncharacterized protein n=1 Tax=Hymenobacter busanensis TaxID=2607656 RepID=A0A7L5A4F2_9BACT|nr:hypothetical protein [Hymenobacter busanensis]KAA9338581.1 hypothetical protein F0P96_07060 [Hymenobacter busanensis]QHJ08990.1 hypothetical protein GUY19_17540 [Hymenobacter busanensis]